MTHTEGPVTASSPCLKSLAGVGSESKIYWLF